MRTTFTEHDGFVHFAVLSNACVHDVLKCLCERHDASMMVVLKCLCECRDAAMMVV